MRNRRYAILALGLILLLVVIVVRFRPTPPTPTKPPDIAKIRQACREQSESGREKQSMRPPGLEYAPYQDLIYVQGQIIVTGPLAEISEIIETLDLTLGEQSLSQQDLNEQVAIRLYQIDDRDGVEQVGCEINRLSRELGFDVFADPNYHTSPAGDWTGGGSPWTQNGDWAQPGGGLGEAQSGNFQSQWAFGLQGIELFSSSGERSVKYTGQGIRIGIFDTSPFTEVGEEGMATVPWQELMGDLRGESFVEESPPLTVWHPIELIPAPNCPGPDRRDREKNREMQNISSHGLFVAGLAHAVAPSSEIYLVRVLEQDACGALSTINEAIEMFIDETWQEKGTLEGTVINLSLGVHEPPSPLQFGLPGEVRSLKYILETAIEKGAVVIAAVGNDSYDIAPDRLPRTMEIPAGYSFVIGVAASNFQGGRGCFSNIGDVAAPGGDGDRPLCENPDCIPICRIPKCSPENSDACLISLVRDPNTGGYAYAYWVGTSFATPLVSGLAALLLEAGESPADVRRIIGNSAVKTSAYEASLGDGVINIQNSLP